MAERVTRGKFSLPVSAEAVAANWRGRGYSCGPFVDPPGREWNDFVHAANELVTVVAGRLALTIGDEQVIAEPGDEVFVPKGAVHSVRNVSATTTRWLFGYD